MPKASSAKPQSRVFLEDCRDTLKRGLLYDYMFAVPPDFAELGIDPKTGQTEYVEFLRSVFSLAEPSSGVVTIAMTDRKNGGVVIPKHAFVIEMMQSLGYRYVFQKIWCKSHKINLFRLNYAFVMTFAKGKVKQTGYKPYKEDVWLGKAERCEGFNYGIALDVVERCIMNFTVEGETVIDPFMGSGTTAIACMETGRMYLGSELSEDHHAIAMKRIARHKKARRMF